MPDLLIRGGAVVTHSGLLAADIAIEDGCIAAIGPDLPGAANEIDACGLVVLPGLIDVHVHFNEPGRTDWEGARTGSHALAAGGGPTFLDMPLNSAPCTTDAAAFDQKRAAVEAASIADFALWGGLIPGNLPQMAELADRGVIGFKAFLCDSGLPEFPRADDLTLFEGMQEAARLGLPVAVHAESDEITQRLSARMQALGRHDIPAFLESRPVIAEVEAIHRAGLLARQTGCSLHIVHISSGSGIAAALEARASGADITIETCPHYLFFSEADLEQIGALAKCAPPLRHRAEQDSLWAALLRGEVGIVGSDHSPCPPELKTFENFFQIWGGIAGVQSTLPVLLDAGHHQRGLPLEQIAALTATNGANRFRLPLKGTVTVGADADLTLIDLNATTHIDDRTLLHRHRASPYSGHSLRGAITQTLRRGEIICSNGAITARTNGRFIRPHGNRNA